MISKATVFWTFICFAWTAFVEAIGAVYPKTQVQRCIIHQILSSTRYVSDKDSKALMADLKLLYRTVTEEEARGNLLAFKDKRRKQYPTCVKSWEENWDMVLTQLDLIFSD